MTKISEDKQNWLEFPPLSVSEYCDSYNRFEMNSKLRVDIDRSVISFLCLRAVEDSDGKPFTVPLVETVGPNCRLVVFDMTYNEYLNDEGDGSMFLFRVSIGGSKRECIFHHSAQQFALEAHDYLAERIGDDHFFGDVWNGFLYESKFSPFISTAKRRKYPPKDDEEPMLATCSSWDDD